MTGQCPIAYKILCLVTKNRSPRAEYEEVAKNLKETYEGSHPHMGRS